MSVLRRLLPFEPLVFVATVALAIVPLWASTHLPMVDLPQHLFLISAGARLGEPHSFASQWFQARDGFTPYLGYYWSVGQLALLFGIDVANRIFLSLIAVLLPVSLAFLLSSLRRPVWPALLVVPLAYGDSFGWGFINWCASIPLVFLALACLVRAARREGPGWSVATALLSFLALVFHVQGYLLFLALAPAFWFLGQPRVDRTPVWVALVSIVPAFAMSAVWLLQRVGLTAGTVEKSIWQECVTIFSRRLIYRSPLWNGFFLLDNSANLLRDGSDKIAFLLFVLIALLAIRAHFRSGDSLRVPGTSVLLASAAIAFGLFFVSPFHVRGYVYYFGQRFAGPATALLLCAIPPLTGAWRRRLVLATLLASAAMAVVLVRGFRAYSSEESALDSLATDLPEHAKVMGLFFDPMSKVVEPPVYLHGAARLARVRRGLANFSFASTPQSPIAYRAAPPPTYPNEWQPQRFRYDEYGAFYDYFVGKGLPPEKVFGPELGKSVDVVANSGEFWLVRRR